MTRQAMLATIHVLVGPSDHDRSPVDETRATLSNLLTETGINKGAIIDWCYASVDGFIQEPSPVEIPDDYDMHTEGLDDIASIHTIQGTLKGRLASRLDQIAAFVRQQCRISPDNTPAWEQIIALANFEDIARLRLETLARKKIKDTGEPPRDAPKGGGNLDDEISFGACWQ